MILFPIALLWVAAVLYFIIRRSTNEPDAPGSEPQPRRFRRPPRTPRGPRPARRETASKR